MLKTARILIYYTLLLFLLAASFHPECVSASEEQTLKIDNVFTDKTAFNPAWGDTARLHFHLSMPAGITVIIYDSLNREITSLIENTTLQAGNHQVTWDGLDRHGNPLPQNYYLYTIEAKSEDGQTVLYDPTDLTGGKQIGVQNIEYERSSNEISFTLKEAAIINLRVGLTGGGPMMNTLIDWLPLTAGQHRIDWDGWDRSRNVNLENANNLDVNGPAYALPMNALILLGEPSLIRPQFLADTEVPGAVRSRNGDPKRRMMYNHWQHPRNTCYDPDIILSLPENQQYDEDGIPLVSGPLKLTLNVKDSDRQFLQDQRFETVFYVDFLYAHEEEMGYLPYYWTWAPHGVNDGTHYITAMLRGYEGHFGTTTIKVLVRKQYNEE